MKYVGACNEAARALNKCLSVEFEAQRKKALVAARATDALFERRYAERMKGQQHEQLK